MRAAFIERPAYDTCGKVEVGQGQSLTVTDPGLTCLGEAAAKRAWAELTVLVPTTEGDPVITYVRVKPDGSLEAFVDPTADAFGGSARAWRFASYPAGTSFAGIGLPVTAAS